MKKNHVFSRLALMIVLGISLIALGLRGDAKAAIVGTSGTVVLELSPFPPSANNQIFVFNEQQGIPFLGTQPLDFGNISPGTLVNSHYLQYDPESSTGSVGTGTVTFDGPIIGVITSTENLYADLNPEIEGTSDSYFGLETLLSPYPSGGDPNARGLGSPEDDLYFEIGHNTLTVDSLDIPVAWNIDGIRIFTAPQIWPYWRHDEKHTGRTSYTGPQDSSHLWTFHTWSESEPSAVDIGEDGTSYTDCIKGPPNAFDPDDLNQDALIIWNYQPGSDIGSSPAIGADGTIYIGSSNGCLYAIDPQGGLKWCFQTWGGIFHSSPAIGTDGIIYIGSYNGRVYAIDQNGNWKYFIEPNGRLIDPNDMNEGWKYDPNKPGQGIWSSPVVYNSKLYMATYDGKVYVLDTNNNKIIWESDPNLRENDPNPRNWSTFSSSPAVGQDGTIYIGSNDYFVYAFDPDDPSGKPKWDFSTGGAVASSPAIGNREGEEIIYVGSYDGNLYAIHSGDGTEYWSFSTGGPIYSSPAIGEDGAIYVGSYDYTVYAIESNGTERWRYMTGGGVASSPAVGYDGIVYVGSNDGTLYAFDPVSGSVLWSYYIGEPISSSPSIGKDGTIYVGSYDGKVYAFGDVPEPIISVTPTGTLDFGAIPIGTYTDKSFTVSNTGSGILSGTASVSSPFSIISGGAYTLSSGQSQDVVIRFTPTASSSCSKTVTFTGGGDATRTVTGTVGVACSYTISPQSMSFTSSGGTGSIQVTTQNGCFWTAISSNAWIAITAGGSGSGTGPVNYAVDANPGSEGRTGTIYIAGETFQVEQGPNHFEMNLSAGWSMISLPVIPDKTRLSAIFPEAEVMYGYHRESGYVRVRDEDALIIGKGYWILLNDAKTYLINGQPIQSYTFPINEDGWEMIGGCTSSAQASADSCNIGVIYGYIQGSGYKRIREGEFLEPGKGFWILFTDISDQCQLIVETGRGL